MPEVEELAREGAEKVAVLVQTTQKRSLFDAVVAACSSTAVAMVFWKSEIRPMISEIWPMASTAPRSSRGLRLLA